MKQSITVLARHGGVIPSPSMLANQINSNLRIGTLDIGKKYTCYQIIKEEIVNSNLFHYFAEAQSRRDTLFLLLHPSADSKLLNVSLTKPSNLKTFSMLTGLFSPSIEESELLINALIDRNGEEFILSGSLQSWHVKRYHKVVERKLRTKSVLDKWFYHIPYGTGNIHNKAMEMRSNRSVIGLDFNSMYASTLSEKNYPSPNSLNYINDKDSRVLFNACLDGRVAGAFICVMSNIDEFLFELLMFSQSFGKFTVKISTRNPIKLILHANEIAFLHQYADIEIIEGVYSTNVIQHPLHKIAKTVYDYRCSGNKIENMIGKNELLLMHTATNKKFNKRLTIDEAVSDYGFRYDDIFHDEHVDCFSFDGKTNVYSLNRQVLANARVKLWRMIVHIKNNVNSAEICYGNIDSMHFSVLKSDVSELLNTIPLSNQMGDLKVDFIADAAIWLNPGRWWAKKDGVLTEFRSGSEKCYPDFNRLSYQFKVNKLTEENYAIEYPEPQSNAYEMASYLAFEMNDTNASLKKIWDTFTSKTIIGLDR